MKHWVFVPDIQKKKYAYISEYPSSKPNIDWGDWDKGEKQGTKAEGAEVTTDERYPGILTDAIPHSFRLPIFSEKLINQLIGIGVTNFETHQVNIRNHESGEVRKDYFVCNVLGLIGCMDKERSEWDRGRSDPESVAGIITLVISEEKIEKHNKRLGKGKELKIFRLEEYTPIIIASDEVKKAFEEIKAQGWKFIPPEKWA